MAKTKEVGKGKKEVAVVKKANVPAVTKSKGDDDVMSLVAKDAGAGMEGADKDAYAIPFLRVLQKISPQCDEGDAAYIRGAKGGMLFNTVTNELYDGKEGIIFIPCAFQRRFIQWGPRGSEGSSFKAEWLPEAIAEKRSSGEITEADGKLYLGEPNPKKSDVIQDTRNHFGIILTDEGAAQVLLSLGSTQIKKSKQLMGILSAVRVNGITPPTWLSKIRLTTVTETNDKGSWYGIKMEAAGFVDSKEIYNAGKAFHDIIASGVAKVDYHAEEAAGGSAAETDDDGKF
jgi:hypothetical protein